MQPPSTWFMTVDNPIRSSLFFTVARPSHRERLIESGVTTLHRRGFTAAGVREITGAAGVPQGAFTNPFRSKEAFGIAVLDRYFERTKAILDATLHDQSRAPVERLRAYFDAITGLLAGAGWRHGCLISNLSLEAAEHSEVLRGRLGQVLGSLTQPIAEVLPAAQAAGEVRAALDAEELAEVLIAAWHGAMLRMKVERRREPLDRFQRVFVVTLLGPAKGAAATGR